MLLYFLRHADAVPDGERPLSTKGHAQMKTVAAFLKRAGVGVDAILTSPLARARETAEAVAPGLGAKVTVVEKLGSGARLGDLQRLLEGFPLRSRVMLVGHEPDFSTLIGTLIGDGAVDVKKASVVLVDCTRVEPGGGVLLWAVPPKLMG